MCENLGIAKTCHLRTQQIKLFQHAHGLKAQRNWIIHKYGLPESRLDSNSVWKTVNSELEKTLLPELMHVIDQGTGRELFKLEQKLRATKNDQSNKNSVPVKLYILEIDVNALIVT